ILHAMRRAVYSLFFIESVERGLGVRATNLLSDEEFLLVDFGLSQTARPGLVLAGRMLFIDDWAYCPGTSLPLSYAAKDTVAQVVERVLGGVSPERSGFADPAPIIRECLRRGVSSRIRYLNEENKPLLPSFAPAIVRGLSAPPRQET